jgi:hypothetical protein
MLTLGIRKIEAFVKSQQELGNNVRWNNYTLEFFRPAEQAIYNAKDGVFRDGQWGYLNKVEVNSKGLWEIDFRNVKRIRRSGN